MLWTWDTSNSIVTDHFSPVLILLRLRLMKHLYLAALLVGGSVLAHTSKAQGLPGYVVQANGDTLAGFVAEKKGKVYVYASTGKTEPRLFRPSQLRGYALQGRP